MSRRIAAWLAMLGVALMSSAAMAQPRIEVTNAWSRATVPGQKVGGVYVDIRSSTPARLVSAASPAAGRVEIHNMKVENGVMKMVPVNGIELPAGQNVKLTPGGNHVMLIDLKRELKEGETVPVVLTVELPDKSRQAITIRAEVRDITGTHRVH